MENSLRNSRVQLGRQVEHWAAAIERLGDLELFAAAGSWEGLEHYLNQSLRKSLRGAVAELQREVLQLRKLWLQTNSSSGIQHLQLGLTQLRRRYQRLETLLDFFIDAINTRANPRIAALLTCCDRMVQSSMNAVLLPLKYQTPPILTYLGEGLGAAILKAGLRLWDQRTENPAAAIKLARHNIYRPTALIHEAGHQVAHILNWNRELARLFLKKLPQSIAPTWASWASEVAADTFAFVHTGYASVAGLHDVVASDVRSVFRFIDGDPHPISYLRVLLGIEMCRQSYGGGPWEGMENAWRTQYPLSAAADDDQILLHESLTAIPTISQLCLRHPMRSFNGLSIVRLVDPKRVSPQVLLQMEARVGHSLFHSSYWLGSETLRILALTGYRIGVEPGNATRLIQRQAEWMQRAGELEHQAHFQSTHYQTYH